MSDKEPMMRAHAHTHIPRVVTRVCCVLCVLMDSVGSSVMSAFVEVVFDNSDGRLPVEGDEVVLRRTIG